MQHAVRLRPDSEGGGFMRSIEKQMGEKNCKPTGHTLRRGWLFVCVLLLTSLTACGSKTELKTEPTDDAPLTGGWAISEQEAVVLPEDVNTAFDKVTTGENLVPVALVAQQVVAGTNDMLLCRNGDEYRVIVIYRDLEGGAELTSNLPFTLTDYTQDGGEASTEILAGGWYAPEETTVLPLPEDAQTAFDKALEGFTGSSVTTMALLGTQVVAGTNYAILCRVTPVVPDAVASTQVVTVYADLQGNAELASFCPIDPVSFHP